MNNFVVLKIHFLTHIFKKKEFNFGDISFTNLFIFSKDCELFDGDTKLLDTFCNNFEAKTRILLDFPTFPPFIIK